MGEVLGVPVPEEAKVTTRPRAASRAEILGAAALEKLLTDAEVASLPDLRARGAARVGWVWCGSDTRLSLQEGGAVAEVGLTIPEGHRLVAWGGNQLVRVVQD